jgi:hypothetical protein
MLFLKDSFKAKEKNDIFLAIWFVSFFAAILILMPLGIARYLLTGFLPLIIIVVNDIKTLFSSARFKTIIYTGIVSTAVWGMLCSLADYKTAETYRTITEEVKSKYKDEKIWFCSDGLKWYMERENYKALIYGDRRPAKGDLVLSSTELWSFYVDEVMERTELIEKVSYDYLLPIRTMNQASNAGFHDNYHGLLPFSITRGVLERFSVYKVVK